MKAIYDREMIKLEWLGGLNKIQVGRRMNKLSNLNWHTEYYEAFLFSTKNILFLHLY